MIHPQAVVHDDCRIGEGTKIWQFASVLRGARIGEGSSIGACAVVDGSAIGPKARIGHGAQVHPGVFAGARLFLGPGAILCNDPWPWLGDREFVLDDLLTGRAFSMMIFDDVTIGAGAVVLPGVTLAQGCIVAAGAVVTGSIPAGALLTRDGAMAPRPEGPNRMRVVA